MIAAVVMAPAACRWPGHAVTAGRRCFGNTHGLHLMEARGEARYGMNSRMIQNSFFDGTKSANRDGGGRHRLAASGVPYMMPLAFMPRRRSIDQQGVLRSAATSAARWSSDGDGRGEVRQTGRFGAMGSRWSVTCASGAST